MLLLPTAQAKTPAFLMDESEWSTRMGKR